MSSSSFEFLYEKEASINNSSSGHSSGKLFPFSNYDSLSPSKISISTQTKSIGPPPIDNFCRDLITRPLAGVDRLHYRRKSHLTKIRGKIIEPARALPDVKLPGWRSLNPGDKIPSRHIPHHRIVFTRGAICENIRKGAVSYILEDPCDNEHVLSSTYDALHDPNTKSYFQNRVVQHHLLAQGLITPNGEVACSLVDFNKWRAYLNKNVSIEQVKHALNQRNVTREANHLQIKRFSEFELQESIKNRQCYRKDRLLNARETKLKRQLETIGRYEQDQAVKHERLFCFKLQLARKHVDRCMRANEVDNKRKYELAQRRRNSAYIRDRLIQQILEKHSVSEKRKENETQQKLVATERHFIESLQTRCQLEEVEKRRESYVTEVMEKEIRAATETRQQNVERQWRTLKRKTKNVDIDEEQKKRLARKTLQKWVTFTNDRRKMRNLNLNTSVFNISTILDKTISCITKQSGHEDSSTEAAVSTTVIPIPISLSNTKHNKSLLSRSRDYQKVKPIVSDFKMKKEPKLCPRSRSERFFNQKPQPSKPRSMVDLERTTKLFDDTMTVLISENRPKCNTKKLSMEQDQGTSTEKVVRTNGERGDSSTAKTNQSDDLNSNSGSASDLRLQHAIINDLIGLPSDFEELTPSIGPDFEGYKFPTPSTSIWSLDSFPGFESQKSTKQMQEDEIDDETNCLYNIARQAQARVAMTSASVTSSLSRSSSESDIELKLDEFTGVIEKEINKDKTGKLKRNFVKTMVKLCIGEKMKNLESTGGQNEYSGVDSRI